MTRQLTTQQTSISSILSILFNLFFFFFFFFSLGFAEPSPLSLFSSLLSCVVGVSFLCFHIVEPTLRFLGPSPWLRQISDVRSSLKDLRSENIDVSLSNKMKKWFGCIFIGSLLLLLVLRYVVIKTPIGGSPLSSPIIINSSNPFKSVQDMFPRAIPPQEPPNAVISTATFVPIPYHKNVSHEMQSSLLTWNHMKQLINYSHGLPNEGIAIKEGQIAWRNLMHSFREAKHGDFDESSPYEFQGKQCPYSVNKLNVSKEFGESGYRLRIPCGLTEGSSITIIAIPDGIRGNFWIDVMGDSAADEADPPIILHYNIRLLGDKITDNPVIVQNTRRGANAWGVEERCPLPIPNNNKKVDELNQCNEMVGNNDGQKVLKDGSRTKNRSRDSQNFPFKQGNLAVMTFRVGEEGIHMTVDGKHITSFAYRENLEPWLVTEVKISGDLNLLSILASGLPTSENLDDFIDPKTLRSVPLTPRQPLDLFIGVVSTANNFRRRMAVRRSWMQYPAVKNGTIAARFFVGLHKNQMVNEELWNEAQRYRDIQLMPFVDYYSLITWKTVAICIYGTKVVSAKYVMKTDDDAFVRVDEVIASLNKADTSNSLLYGLINFDSRPHRSRDSKWYISYKEWPEYTYPPWAHGPGYVISQDIAKTVAEKRRGQLKMFKLEDVAMGIWISEMIEQGLQVHYINEERVYNVGCKDGFVVAHYQSPSEMLCLWQNLHEKGAANCCEDR